ncbi:hypothetical protein Golob_026043, partial [Gossypium lobatum]|nr:hypothetical protein [Gossypium lobatum]
ILSGSERDKVPGRTSRRRRGVVGIS